MGVTACKASSFVEDFFPLSMMRTGSILDSLRPSLPPQQPGGVYIAGPRAQPITIRRHLVEHPRTNETKPRSFNNSFQLLRKEKHVYKEASFDLRRCSSFAWRHQ